MADDNWQKLVYRVSERAVYNFCDYLLKTSNKIAYNYFNYLHKLSFKFYFNNVLYVSMYSYTADEQGFSCPRITLKL
jgi:hypothetical protein